VPFRGQGQRRHGGDYSLLLNDYHNMITYNYKTCNQNQLSRHACFVIKY
jgi:hypothetical protein